MGKKRPKITRITESVWIHLEYSASAEQLLADNDIDYKIWNVAELEEIDEPESEEELEVLKRAIQDLKERRETHELRERKEAHRIQMNLPNIIN